MSEEACEMSLNSCLEDWGTIFSGIRSLYPSFLPWADHREGQEKKLLPVEFEYSLDHFPPFLMATVFWTSNTMYIVLGLIDNLDACHILHLLFFKYDHALLCVLFGTQ